MKAFSLRTQIVYMLSVVALLVVLLLVPGAPPGISQPVAQVESDQFLFPGPTKEIPATTLGEQLKGVPLPEWLAKQQIGGDLRLKPFLYWRAWAKRPVPVFPAFVFFLLTSMAGWALIPAILEQARSICVTRFWKSLFTGLFTVIVSLVFSRCLFISELGGPLALIVMGVSQLGMLLGLAVSASMVSKLVLTRLRIGHDAGSEVQKLAGELAVGVGLISLLFLIPGIGDMPRIGTRCVMLFAALGLGGIVQSICSRKDM
ncbi:MAG: hypothetical protein HY711_09685 [Candidatus Melainabacteria bacterium]|nr:hypothetical protein [Candidatus Melainabacteria bacterium]